VGKEVRKDRTRGNKRKREKLLKHENGREKKRMRTNN
jgi:hypothetical protein